MSTPKKILLIEDEFTIALDIEARLQKLGYTLVGIAQNYDEGVLLLQSTTPDAVILDIHLKGSKSGIELAKHLRENYTLPFLFLTAFSDAATFEKAKETQPNGFILKPFKNEDLRNNIELAIASFKEQPNTSDADAFAKMASALLNKTNPAQKIALPTLDGFEFVAASTILYITADGNYSYIHTESGKPFLVSKSLKEVESLLPKHFLRIHQSHIVNLNRIQKYNRGDGGDVVMENRKSLPVSRSRKQDLLEKISNAV